MDDADRIDAYKTYLRRTYRNDLVGLKRLAEELVTTGGALDAVTITTSSFEGGAAQGVVAFDPMAKLKAVEEVIAELDSDAPLPTPDRSFARFRAPTIEIELPS